MHFCTPKKMINNYFQKWHVKLTNAFIIVLQGWVNQANHCINMILYEAGIKQFQILKSKDIGLVLMTFAWSKHLVLWTSGTIVTTDASVTSNLSSEAVT